MLKKTRGFGLITLFLYSGCISGTESAAPMPATDDVLSGTEEAATADRDELPPALVSVDLGKGRSVNFYDLKIGALVISQGPADTQDPTLMNAMNTVHAHHGVDHLVDAYAALRPDLPVPKELIDLQERLTNGPAVSLPDVVRPAWASGDQQPVSAPNEPVVGSDGAEGRVAAALQPAERTLVGCNNGCCDPDWTRNTVCGFVLGLSWSYYQFNYGSTGDDSPSPINYGNSKVCAAVGDTSWTWGYSDTCGGVQYSRQVVKQGTLSSWEYNEGTFCYGGSMWSGTNSSRFPHTHMACGGATTSWL